MKQRWQQWVVRYAALSLRERALVAVAAVALILFVGDALWLNPIYQRAQNFARQTAQQEREFAKLQAQIAQLQLDGANDPSQALRAQLAEAEREMAGIDQQLAAFEARLIPPGRMSAVLGQLLRERRGVRLLSLKTLPPERLGETVAEPAPAGAAAAAEPVSRESGGGTPLMSIYRHGVELKLEGNYLDLVACLADLEAQGQQLLWERASLVAGNERRSTLTLRLFSLSLDKSWMAL